MCERRCKRKCYPHVTHCIFDLDGTLLDTETIYARVFTTMLHEYGATYTSNLRRQTMGATTEKCWEILVNECNLREKTAKLVDNFKKRSYDLLGDCRLMPGTERLVAHLCDHKIPIAIATSSAETMYYRKIEPHQKFFANFHHVVCGGSDPAVKESKPNPDIFLICAERFAENPCPSDCLVFEDSPNGVVAARRAGMQCIAIPEKDMPKEAFKQATLILESMEEFEPERFGMPCLFTSNDK
ncbi:hypothetical protein Trydic_g6808 [Trypoxylus dichotomus]